MLHASIERNLPIRFNSVRSLRSIFYIQCDSYPKHCQKIRFGNINDLRIIVIDTSNNSVKLSLDFSYHAENIEHYATVILESKIKSILNKIIIYK